MDEQTYQTMQEMMDAHEQEKQEWFETKKSMQKQINALEGKYKGSVRTIQKQNKELDKLRPKKQKGYRNQPKNYRR